MNEHNRMTAHRTGGEKRMDVEISLAGDFDA